MDKYERNSIIRSFLLKVILVIIAALLIAWLVPKIIYNNNPNNTPSIDLTPLTNQIFSDNLEKMKDAGIAYFTTERLPKKVGDSKTITLEEMYELKLLTTLTDKNGNKCDAKGSYIKLTNNDKEYLMKVNLKCGSEEDYILVHLGCYSYCKSGLCEKKTTGIEKGSVSYNVKGGSKTTTSTVKVVTKTVEENKTCPEGYVFNADKTLCIKKTYTCPAGYKLSADKKTCIKEVTPKPDTPQKNYIYQYVKTTDAEMGNWTPWTSWKEYLDKDNISDITCDAKDFTCLREVKTKKEFEQVGTYDKVYRTSHQESRQYGSYEEKYCKQYNYVVYETTVYQTTGSGYSNISSGEWVAEGGKVAYTNPPADTATTRYKLVGANYSGCTSTCQTTPTFYYQKYVYKPGLTKVGTYNTTTHTTTSVTVTCKEVASKTVPVYANVTVYDYDTRTEPLYAYIKYYQERTRKLEKEATTTYKWSKFNDKDLLNAGYKYTGKSKEV